MTISRSKKSRSCHVKLGWQKHTQNSHLDAKNSQNIWKNSTTMVVMLGGWVRAWQLADRRCLAPFSQEYGADISLAFFNICEAYQEMFSDQLSPTQHFLLPLSRSREWAKTVSWKCKERLKPQHSILTRNWDSYPPNSAGRGGGLVSCLVKFSNRMERVRYWAAGEMGSVVSTWPAISNYQNSV